MPAPAGVGSRGRVVFSSGNLPAILDRSGEQSAQDVGDHAGRLVQQLDYHRLRRPITARHASTITPTVTAGGARRRQAAAAVFWRRPAAEPALSSGPGPGPSRPPTGRSSAARTCGLRAGCAAAQPSRQSAGSPDWHRSAGAQIAGSSCPPPAPSHLPCRPVPPRSRRAARGSRGFSCVSCCGSWLSTACSGATAPPSAAVIADT